MTAEQMLRHLRRANDVARATMEPAAIRSVRCWSPLTARRCCSRRATSTP